MPKIFVPIRGMHCKSCKILIEKSLSKVPEIIKADVSRKDGKADIWYEGATAPMAAIQKRVKI
jgi:copper chaperone CopZ